MIEVRSTAEFSDWLRGLKDTQGRARIVKRIDRLAVGNFGDAKSVGEGVSELRFMFGPGYGPTTRVAVTSSLFCCVAEISPRSRMTSSELKLWQRRLSDGH